MNKGKRRQRRRKCRRVRKAKKAVGFSKYFTRNGVKYYAEDYGYDAWPFGNPKK